MATSRSTKKATTISEDSTSVVTTEMTFSAPATQAEVPQTIEKLKSMLAALQGGSDKAVNTDISYKGQSIAKITKIGDLIEIGGAIEWRNKVHEEGLEKYGLKGQVAAFQVEGHSPAHWEKVIDKAIKELLNKNKIDKIKKAITELSKHLDEQTKLQNTLKNITEDVLSPLS